VFRPDTPLNDVPRRPRALPDRATRVRRRRLAALVAALVLALAVAGAVQAVVWLANVGSSPAPEALDPGTAQRVAGQVYVVQPGDTLWSIAAEIAPDRDPRVVVDALRQANGGGVALEVGQRLTIVLD
jgi:Tfp pilus assembly protein FimV